MEPVQLERKAYENGDFIIIEKRLGLLDCVNGEETVGTTVLPNGKDGWDKRATE